MPLSYRRLVTGASVTIGLLVVVMVLRLAFEWRQALADIDSMIVTPAVLDLSTEAQVASTEAAHNQGATSETTPFPTALPQVFITPAVEEPPPPLSQATLHILLLGTDARPDDLDPTRTDALVLVRIDRDRGQVSMLSLPRDLWVSYPTGGQGRINAAYPIGEVRFGAGGGAALAKSTVGRLLGVEVDYFMLINFRGFETLIDEIGGIRVDVPYEIYDPTYPTEDYGTMEVHFDAGPQILDAERALIYVRTRHADSDFGRNQRQQQVLMAIFERIRERGLLMQLTSIDNYTRAMRGYIQTDLSRGMMFELAGFARTLNSDNILRYAIDSRSIVELQEPATFEAHPQALARIMRQFKGEVITTASGN
ncbi:LCP family protein [Candidatus Viridilinea mediisalina]|uniref:Transcriptional regulator n=1 Tax=Candidatus Viridilinea mediisalina TaxID=2024553 RepID=A0A2A6RNY1_9CHLR|nr:LCP family protein [Candidatus Viridilinea mediisalina]PDW04645.1 transcriptional regulator [Candidatus Viridilinea mediisalina]